MMSKIINIRYATNKQNALSVMQLTCELVNLYIQMHIRVAALRKKKSLNSD